MKKAMTTNLVWNIDSDEDYKIIKKMIEKALEIKT